MDEELLRNTAAMVTAQGVLIEHLLALHLSRYPRDEAEQTARELAKLLDPPGPAMGLSDEQAEAMADVTVRAQVHLRAAALRALLAAAGLRTASSDPSIAGDQ